jgi:hypothetical protein
MAQGLLTATTAGLSRFRTSTSTSAGRPDAFDDPMDVRLGGRLPADSEAISCPLAATTGGRSGKTTLRLPKGVAVRQPPRPSSKAVRWRRTAAPSAGSRPPPLSIWGRPPTPSALYDSNFSFLHYVFASLIAVT